MSPRRLGDMTLDVRLNKMKMKSTWLIALFAFAVGLGVGILFSSQRIKQEQNRMSGLVRAVDVMNLSNPLRFLRNGEPDKATQVLEMTLRSTLDIARKQQHPHGAVNTSPDLVTRAEALLDSKPETEAPNEASQAIGANAPQPER